MYEAGVHTVKQLAVLCKDVDELRGMAKEALDIDPTKGPMGEGEAISGFGGF